jgi:hypothetical protein
MQHFFKYIAVYILTLIVSFSLCGEELNHNVLPYKKNLKEKILEGAIFSESTVKSSILGENKIQELQFTIAGLHDKSCAYALKTLSLYENYSKFINFVKKSTYDNKTEILNFELSHALLPYDMSLIFKLPRIVKVGSYPFLFDQGILKDLQGTIFVVNHQNRCLFFSRAHWRGPTTGFPDIIFEFFSQTLAKLTMVKLFRISSTLSH